MEKKVIYYEDIKGSKPVKVFLGQLSSEIRGKILARIVYLGEHWGELRRPQVDFLEDGLYELRIQFAKNDFRIIYAYMFRNCIVLLHGFRKSTSQISENDKLRAQNRKTDFQLRYNEGRIKL